MKKLLFLLLPLCLFADKAVLEPEKDVQEPWLTGPLLAPSSLVIPLGHFNLEPYGYVIAQTGVYNRHWKPRKIENFWENSFQPQLQFGMAPRVDFEVAPTLYYNYREGAAKWAFGDLTLLTDIQIYRSHFRKGDTFPNVKLILSEVFPTGKYQHLDPKKGGTDRGGLGAYSTSVGLVFGRLFHLEGVHFLSARLLFQYTLPSPVRVKGLNAYGGGVGTNATVYPFQSFEIDLGTEITLTRNWAFALDLLGNWSTKTHFKGKSGIQPDGTPARLSYPASVQLSIAPAIEYNWNGNVGIIFGSWFTLAGRNSTQFYSGIIALNYYN